MLNPQQQKQTQIFFFFFFFCCEHRELVLENGNDHGVWKEILGCNLKGDTEGQVLQPFVSVAKNPLSSSAMSLKL